MGRANAIIPAMISLRFCQRCFERELHECFTGKYTTHKIHKNYIRDPSGLFSIITREFIDDVILPVIFLYYFIDVILSML